MTKTKKFIILILIFLFIIISLYFTNNIGINKNRIEKDARKSGSIDDSFEVVSDSTKDIHALLFYNKEIDKYSYRIYINRPGISLGYFFRGGGSLIDPNNYIEEVHIDGYDEKIFISTNKQNIYKVEIDNGNKGEIIDIDSKNPFIIILPKNSGIINFFDIKENIVDIIKYSL